jgi:hypothetical protein
MYRTEQNSDWHLAALGGRKAGLDWCGTTAALGGTEPAAAGPGRGPVVASGHRCVHQHAGFGCSQPALVLCGGVMWGSLRCATQAVGLLGVVQCCAMPTVPEGSGISSSREGLGTGDGREPGSAMPWELPRVVAQWPAAKLAALCRCCLAGQQRRL